ncbi:MAG: hypothetical protein FWE23_01675 [Chitinivibrionia bacterium]|nr:hypothetical protein [Chitinivibrionia bacterium]
MGKKRPLNPIFEAQPEPQEQKPAANAQNFIASLNKEKLREAIILKEILDLPVSLR